MTNTALRTLAVALLGGIAALPGMAHAREDIGRSVAKALPRLQASMNGNDCQGALKTISPILGRKEFATLVPRQQLPLLLAATLCEGSTNRLESALAHARALTALPVAPDLAWRMRFGIELDSGLNADAVTTLETMQKQAPSALALLEDRWILALARRFADHADDAAYRRLLALTTDPAFAPARDNRSYEELRLDYARLLAAGDEKKAASAQIAAIHSAGLLVNASFDPVLATYLPASFDARAAYEREAADLAARSLVRPALLELPIDLASTQRALGEPEKALATLEAARPEGVLARQFSDRDRRINWWWDGLARTHEQLGHYDKAVEAYRSGIESGEQGRANFSQRVNLAYLHVRFGHPQDALSVLEPFASGTPQASPYGIMEYHLAHACAAQALGQTAVADADLAYAETHAKDHPEALTDMQLCLGRIDMAAASMIARLANPDLRLDALLQLSTWRALPAAVPPGVFDAGLQALRSRPDVQAAAAQAGGTRHFDIHSTTL